MIERKWAKFQTNCKTLAVQKEKTIEKTNGGKPPIFVQKTNKTEHFWWYFKPTSQQNFSHEFHQQILLRLQRDQKVIIVKSPISSPIVMPQNERLIMSSSTSNICPPVRNSSVSCRGVLSSLFTKGKESSRNWWSAKQSAKSRRSSHLLQPRSAV